MDLRIKHLPSDVNEWTVTRAIAQVLHADDFAHRSDDSERLVNFKVKLNPSRQGGVRNDGTGILTLPQANLALKFLAWVRDSPIKIDKKKIIFYKSTTKPWQDVSQTLQKTPYINPDIEEERQSRLYGLQEALRVDAVQFGVFYRPEYPIHADDPLKTRAFSIEWELTQSIGWLRFEYDHKLIRIQLGDEMTEKIGSTVAIHFSSISKIGLGYDGKPYICFDTLTPPVLEEIQFHRALTGIEHKDRRKFKHRIGSLHPGHERVAPYAQHLRVELYNDPNVDMVDKFASLCKIAGLACENIIIRSKGPHDRIDACRREFFKHKRLHHIRHWLIQFDWPVAFQLELLLHNSLLHTDDLLALSDPIHELCKKHSDDEGLFVGQLLRRFNEVLQSRSPRESPIHCFRRVSDNFTFAKPDLSSGTFLCCHVTFTPTRMLLEGPYATQSNRVIRLYPGYENNFLRVDFRDEDRLQYRWQREVDGTSFLRERVGGILKNGFELAGRQFEFLAYSSSALREHAVWFIHPFAIPGPDQEAVLVTSERIRSSLGDFKGTPLLQCPSKYAARLAQAFTATYPSVKITRDQWHVVDDLGTKPYQFTDGVGTISKELGDMIWEALCVSRRDHGEHSVQPSAYQIRFLGYKGVVAVDEQLKGIQMRLRPSMGKFENKKAKEAEIEIAQAFERPVTCYLNRPLVMILEDLGVRKDTFVDLQDQAIAEARTINDSIVQFHNILRWHGLGNGYHLSSLLKRIESLGLDLITHRGTPGIDNPFLRQLRQVAMTGVLRDIKHNARIPIPNSYLLVGVADEGPAYRESGHENVFTLPEGNIYACIQNIGDSEPTWLKGTCSISRSPVAHPGDVQRVFAIGKPPEDKLCLFAHLKNVVVLPSVGKRSLASCLGGGDVDGDLFAIIQYSPLLPSAVEDPAEYPAGETFTLRRDSTVDDICDFIVEYINSDVVGLLSDRLLVIADQSTDGIRDPDCLKLAELCSQAVDYPKQGIAVNIDDDRLPRALIRCNPDWHAAEVVSPRKTDFYESSRALGYLYRAITLEDPDPIGLPDQEAPRRPLTDTLSLALKHHIQCQIQTYIEPDGTSADIRKTFNRYADELRYICATHTLSNTPGVRLLEAEVVIGTILAKCSQKRWRKDRMYRMRLHASMLVREIQRELLEKFDQDSMEELGCGLERAWNAWDFSLRHSKEFGANSFGLIALGVVFDCLERLGGLSPP